MRKVQSSKKAVAMACTFALAVAVVAMSGVPARTQDNSGKTHLGVPTPGQGGPQEESLPTTKHVLNSVLYDSSIGAFASCSTTGCTATANIFTENIACPGPAGTKCTYEVDIAAQTEISSAGEDGLFQFLIDGAAPNGGGTGGDGLYSVEDLGAAGLYTNAYTVTSQVQNASTNQSHSIVVNIGCIDTLGVGGCTGTAGFSDLTVGVLKP
jgi:hypothetical protein